VKYAGESTAKILMEGKAGSTGSQHYQQFLSRVADSELGRSIKECQRRLPMTVTDRADENEESLLTLFDM